MKPGIVPSLVLLAVLSLGYACGSDGEGSAEDSIYPDAPLLTGTTDSLDLEVEVRTSPQPPRKGLAAVQLVVTDAASGELVEGLSIVVSPWMGSMSHGSNEVTTKAVSPGIYEAEGVLFSMPGRWELQLRIGGSHADYLETSSFDVLP